MHESQLRRKTDIRNVKLDGKVILLDLDFAWQNEDIETVKTMWQEGYGIEKISRKIQREVDEVFLLLLHLARQGEIKERPYGVWGVI
jgi:hypothetical protein